MARCLYFKAIVNMKHVWRNVAEFLANLLMTPNKQKYMFVLLSIVLTLHTLTIQHEGCFTRVIEKAHLRCASVLPPNNCIVYRTVTYDGALLSIYIRAQSEHRSYNIYSLASKISKVSRVLGYLCFSPRTYCVYHESFTFQVGSSKFLQLP